jgi:hypothetical protein
VPRQGREVADIFRAHGPAWRQAQAGHLSLGQLKVMRAIERCRTAAASLSWRFRRLFLDKLAEPHQADRLRLFGDSLRRADAKAFARYPRPLRKLEGVVYAKPPFAGPEPVFADPSRDTHRVAIANSRLIALDDQGVTFRCKD